MAEYQEKIESPSIIQISHVNWQKGKPYRDIRVCFIALISPSPTPLKPLILPILGQFRSSVLCIKKKQFLKLRKKFKNRKGKQYQPQWQEYNQNLLFFCNSNPSQNLNATAFLTPELNAPLSSNSHSRMLLKALQNARLQESTIPLPRYKQQLTGLVCAASPGKSWDKWNWPVYPISWLSIQWPRCNTSGTPLGSLGAAAIQHRHHLSIVYSPC